MPDIQVLIPPFTDLGESPWWDVESERLWWIDVARGTVLRATADGREIRVSTFPGHPTSLALRSGGGAIVTARAGIYQWDLDTGELDAAFDAETDMGFNDGTVDRQGRFLTALADPELIDPAAFELVGTKDPRGRIYRMDPDGTTCDLGQRVGVSNGPCFSPDGTTLYWGDSWARVIYAFDYDPATGEASDRRALVRFHDDSPPGVTAVPDGATVDAEGGIWVAACYGSEIRRYAPDGTLDRRVRVPVVSPTNVAFGGSDLDILFITSIRESRLPGGLHRGGPLAGTILAVHGLGARGVPETRFAG